jgi:hypothetical protein
MQVGDVFYTIEIFDREGAFLRRHGSKREQQENKKQEGATDHSVDSFGISAVIAATVLTSAVLSMGSYSITKY